MKKYLFQALLIAGLTSIYNYHLAAQSVPNAGFEKWSSHGDYQEPESWMSEDSLLAWMPGNTEFSVSPTDTAFEGDKAVLLESKYYQFLGKTIPGVITNGAFDLNNHGQPQFTGGSPFASRPAAIQFHYRYLPSKDDIFLASVFLFKFNSAKGTRDTIGQGILEEGKKAMTYTAREIHIDYFKPDAPDTILLLFISSSVKAVPGTRLFIDNIVPLATSGIPDERNDILLSEVYPNPASGIVHVKASENCLGGTYTISDITGRKVHCLGTVSSQEFSVDVSALKPGVYSLVLAKNGQFTERRLVVFR